MANELKNFADSAKGLSKSPLGIIALFIVLVYGFATLASVFGHNFNNYIGLLVYFLILFPIIVFGGFLWLVAVHSDKIYGPSDFKNEDNFIKMKLFSVASLTAATVKGMDAHTEITEQQINSLVESVSKIDTPKTGNNNVLNRILWVDDRPENNIYVRRAFEAQGIEISLALSTNEAIERLKIIKYGVIISDMGRKEGADEGYVLLSKIRKSGITTPFFIYAGSNSEEHRRMALEKGAQGSTNNAQELYEWVINSFMTK